MSEDKQHTFAKSGWIVLLVAWVALAAVGCEKQNEADGSEQDKAQAVESDDDDQAESDEGSAKEGAAASDEDRADEEGDQQAEAPEKATVGKPAPDFTLPDATGEKHTLSEYRGEPVVLEWLNPECPYVQRHYDSETMTSTLERLGGADEVTWLAIDSSHHNEPKDSKAWKEKHGFEYPVLQDPEGEVGQRYGAKTTPHMYVVDSDGVLRYNGAIDDSPKGEKDAPTNYVLQAVTALQDDEEVDPRTSKPYGCSVKYDG